MKREGLKASMSTLMALCEKADNDVRTCLNSVQVTVALCKASLQILVVVNIAVYGTQAQGDHS